MLGGDPRESAPRTCANRPEGLAHPEGSGSEYAIYTLSQEAFGVRRGLASVTLADGDGRAVRTSTLDRTQREALRRQIAVLVGDRGHFSLMLSAGRAGPSVPRPSVPRPRTADRAPDRAPAEVVAGALHTGRGGV